MKRLLFLLLFSVCLLPLAAQQDIRISADLGFGESAQTLSASAYRLHHLGKKKQRLRLGYGVRLTAAQGRDLEYLTAPGALFATKPGVFAVFSEPNRSNLDTLTLDRAFLVSLNLMGVVEYQLARRIAIGMNIDVIGLSFGGGRSGTLRASSQRPGPYPVDAEPSGNNLLLGGPNDFGSLNSQFYVQVQATPSISLRGGLSHQFLEWRTSEKQAFDNDRFRWKGNLYFIGIIWHLNPVASEPVPTE